MRIGLVAPPFIPVPPRQYGGTELFIAQLTSYLHERGHQVIVYSNGESDLPCEVRWRFPRGEWPLPDVYAGMYKSLTHLAWAIEDANDDVDVLHLNDACGASLSPFLRRPTVMTLHHPYEAPLAELYQDHAQLQYVAISRSQASRYQLPNLSVIHHGLDPDAYLCRERKDGYLAFLGRLAPYKGAHTAIEVAKRTGIPLKIAGEIQPAFREYWETRVRPHIDGRLITFVGEADHRLKNELLGGAMALLFPIEWEEPFGLVMIESLACGTPVLAFNRGSVPEIIEDGVTGWICRDVDELAARARELALDPLECRAAVLERFSIDVMGRAYETLYQALVTRFEAPPALAAQ